MKKSTKKTLKGSDIDDDLLSSFDDMRDFKCPKEYNFHKFVECDFAYIVNDWGLPKKLKGSMVILVKNQKILDVFGPVAKIKVACEFVHGETLEFSFLSKNKFKIKHPFFKLAISKSSDVITIQGRNIFKEEFLYEQ